MTCSARRRPVAEKLHEFGCDEVVTGLGRTGVVGVIHGRKGKSDKAIGLRADMDALPIEEETGLPYKSTNPGKMHACGHDGHTAMLLGAARYLAETRNFAGTAVVIFQPAEEGGAGGKAMVEDGLIDALSASARSTACTIIPACRSGNSASAPAPMMAATDFIPSTSKASAATPRARISASIRCWWRADHHRHPVDRVAQCRPAEVGGGVDPDGARGQCRQRHSADRAVEGHGAQPVGRRARVVGDAAAPGGGGHGGGARGQGQAHLPAQLSGAGQPRTADAFRGFGRRRNRRRIRSTPTCRR